MCVLQGSVSALRSGEVRLEHRALFDIVQQGNFGNNSMYPLVIKNIAMENGPFMDVFLNDLPIKSGGYP